MAVLREEHVNNSTTHPGHGASAGLVSQNYIVLLELFDSVVSKIPPIPGHSRSQNNSNFIPTDLL